MKRKSLISFALIITVLTVQMTACNLLNDRSNISTNSTPCVSESNTSYALDESGEAEPPTDSDGQNGISQAPEESQILSNEYCATVMCTDPLRNDGIFPYCNIIRSEETMNDYCNSVREIYSLENTGTDEDSVDAFIKKHTSKWFENNALIIVVTPAPEVADIGISGERMTIYLTETNESDCTSIYHVFIEISNIYVDNVEYIDVE